MIDRTRKQAVRRLQGLLATVTLAVSIAIVFAGCTVSIETPQIRTSTFPSTSGTSSGSGITVPVKVLRGQGGSTLVLLAVTINGRGPYTFALDTGASQSLIDRPLARQLGLQQAGPAEPISGVGGNETAVPVHISNWHTGKINFPDTVIASAGLAQIRPGTDLRGLIGSDIWRQFGTITIDYANSTLTVYKQLAQVEPSGTTTAPAVAAGILIAESYARRIHA